MRESSPLGRIVCAQVEVLSGGEKARLALAKFMLSQVRLFRCPPCVGCSIVFQLRAFRGLHQRRHFLQSHPRLIGALLIRMSPTSRLPAACCSTTAQTQHADAYGCLSAALQGTLLVLDEPTNHLDIPSKEMLEEALQRFDGSVIAVSHDRYFLRRIATRVVTVRLDNPSLTWLPVKIPPCKLQPAE